MLHRESRPGRFQNDLLDVYERSVREENNLTVHVAALRKALGETKSENRYIVTIPGRGYQFVAQLKASQISEIVLESHSFEHVVYEEEIEVETDEHDLSAEAASASAFRSPMPQSSVL